MLGNLQSFVFIYTLQKVLVKMAAAAVNPSDIGDLGKAARGQTKGVNLIIIWNTIMVFAVIITNVLVEHHHSWF